MDKHKIVQIGEVKWKKEHLKKNVKDFKWKSGACICIHPLSYEAPK